CEIVGRPPPGGVELACARACEGALEQEPGLGTPSFPQHEGRLARERLDEDLVEREGLCQSQRLLEPGSGRLELAAEDLHPAELRERRGELFARTALLQGGK